MDEITITAPVGVTSVNLTYTSYFDGVFNVPGGLVSGSYQSDASFFANVNVSASNPQEVFEHVLSGGGTIHDVLTRTVTATPGVPFAIEEQLVLDATSGVLAGAGSSLVDAHDTAGIYFSVDTPGALLTSASGQDYSAPITSVPEPSSPLLMLSALFAGIVWTRVRLSDWRFGVPKLIAARLARTQTAL